MANELTGDFEVVAEFSIPAANRILAAMHRGNRLPHELSIRVDPRPPRVLSPDRPHVPSAVGVVSAYGQAVADPRELVEATERPSTFYAPAVAGTSIVDQPVNVLDIVGLDREDLQIAEVVGVAQAQLSAPTLEVHPQSDTRITLSNRARVRYFGEKGSRELPQYLRGEVRTSVEVDRVASQVGDVIEIDLKSSNTDVAFLLAWADPAATSAQRDAIQKAVQRVVTTSFQPSNIPLPSGRHIQLKTLSGFLQAICVLIGMNDGSGDAASVGMVFLGGADDFAFAVSADHIQAEFKKHIDKVLTERGLRTFPYQFKASDWFGFVKIDITWTISLDDVTIEVKDGEILLTIHGQGLTQNTLFNFAFRARQAFTLKLEGDTAALEPKGDVDLEPTSGGLTAAMISHFKGEAVTPLRDRREQAVNYVQPAVRETLSAQTNLGTFLKRLLNPVPGKGIPLKQLSPEFAYTAFEIKAAGLILHGTLAVPDWPAPQVEFELTPWKTATGAKEYSALHTWIPGGTIEKYVWQRHFDAPAEEDENTFVYEEGSALFPISPYQDSAAIQAAMQVVGSPAQKPQAFFSAMCLTVVGKRLTASGPVVEEDVRARRCAWPGILLSMVADSPAVGDAAGPAGASGAAGRGRAGRRQMPDVALTQVSASGALEVVGHASPWVSARPSGRGSPNLIVHFPGDRSDADLGWLTTAVRESGRTNAATAILAVLSREALAGTRPADGVTVTDDPEGAWRDLLGVERLPATIVVNPSGRIAWRHEGETTLERLAPALREHLVDGEVVVPHVLDSRVRVGHPPPNFMFTYALGRELTLRKLIGRPVVLTFWKRSSQSSVDTVRLVQERLGREDGEQPLLLAIENGESVADETVSAGSGSGTIMVPDPAGRIAGPYGISVWPTTIFIDADGVVREIRYGRPSNGQGAQGAADRRAD